MRHVNCNAHPYQARIRVAAPKLVLVSVFALVTADIFLVTAPLLPTFQGTIPKTMIIPVAVAISIGAVCNIIFFPQSTSHVVMDGIRDLIRSMKGFPAALQWQFKNPNIRMNLDRLTRIKVDLADTNKGLDTSTKFLPMDFTYGRLSPDDITSLNEPIRNMLVAFVELLQLQINHEEGQVKEEELFAAADEVYDEKHSAQGHQVGHHQITRAVDIRSRRRHPDTDHVMDQSFRTLSTSAERLMQEIEKALEAIDQALAGDARKLKTRDQVIKAHADVLEALKESEATFISSGARDLVQQHSKYFDETGHIILPKDDTELPPPLLGLMLGILFQERIQNLSKNLISVLERINELEATRTQRRFWGPRGLQKLLSWGLEKDAVPTTVKGSVDLRPTTSHVSHDESKRRKRFSKKKKTDISGLEPTNTAKARLENMRKPTGRRRHTSSRILLNIIHWLGNTEGIFALRVLIVTIALSIPAVVPATAGFYYREKGMWATLMAQLGLVPYTSDFVSGLIIRTVGTAAGGVIGLAAWYIGSGNGPGNPYGMSAVLAVVIVVFMWWRLFAPAEHMSAGIMLTSTAYMVVAFSWIDTHIPSYGNPGVGYNIVWRRVLLVLIGFTAATIVMFLPRPPSGSRHYRRLLAESLGAAKDQYALFASTWRDPPSDFVEVVEKEAIANGEILTSMEAPIKLTKYEFSTSNFEAKTLSQTLQLCMSINHNITQLLLSTARLPVDMRSRFLQNSNAANENLIADVMAVLTLLQQSLRSGDPLPALLPTPLLGRSFHFGGIGKEGTETSFNAGKQLADDSGRKYVCAVFALVQLLGAIDELVIVVKRAVGETNDIDLERL
jgi:hypothetical protein